MGYPIICRGVMVAMYHTEVLLSDVNKFKKCELHRWSVFEGLFNVMSCDGPWKSSSLWLRPLNLHSSDLQ